MQVHDDGRGIRVSLLDSPNASRAWPGNAVAASSKSARSASLNIRSWSNKPNRAVNTDCFHRVGSGARR